MYNKGVLSVVGLSVVIAAEVAVTVQIIYNAATIITSYRGGFLAVIRPDVAPFCGYAQKLAGEWEGVVFAVGVA